MTVQKSDYLIIGGGIMGLAVARMLLRRNHSASITLLEKEDDVAFHASGRNSGVLHAGFYYTADSLKAKFCRDGNAAMRAYVTTNNLKINDCKKVVVTQSEAEVETLRELFRRGQVNGVPLELVDEKQLAEIEPNAKTVHQAIYASTTAIVDPIEICQTLRKELEAQGVKILTRTPYQKRVGDRMVQAGDMRFQAEKIINCAGLYADRVARDFGFCQNYAIIPFKGVYLKYKGSEKPIKRCIYPVPNLKNPFLGVHYSVTVDGTVKIGPTAIPAFWRENYKGFDNFSAREFAEVMRWESQLFATNAFGFRNLAITEMKKYIPSHMANLAANMVKNIDASNFTGFTRAGIRSQLLDKRTLKLLQDFVVESDDGSVHVLNAVSPAFTSSFPFAQWIVDNHVEKTISGS